MISFIVLLYYYASAYNPGIAAPITSSIDSDNSLVWLLSPRDTGCPRKRLEIIWSCIATILAASWVSVHPNLPHPDDSMLNKTLRRVELMFWAIITPELIIFWAMRQWYGARQMEREFSEYLSKEASETKSIELSPLEADTRNNQQPTEIDNFKWTRTHGFFLQMGGFVLQTSDKTKRILGWKPLLQYYKDGRIDLSDITEARIKDHSKADGFAKGLALLQTCWFIVQSVARFSDNDLVLTELELATAALAVLSLVMYFLWWNKPFNAEIPIIIILSEAEIGSSTHDIRVIDEAEEAPDDNDSSIISIAGNLSEPWSSDENITREVAPEDLNSIIDSQRTLSYQDTDIEEQSESTRLNIFMQTFNIVWNRIKALISRRGIADFTMPDPLNNENIRVMKAPTFYSIQAESFIGAFKMLWASFAVATLFGAIHCIGWSSKMLFSSHATSLLWKISSANITVVPVIWSAFFVVDYLMDKSQYGSLRMKVSDTLRTIFGFQSVPAMPLYIISRIILLVLAFLELRDVPPGALGTIKWAHFVPFIH